MTHHWLQWMNTNTDNLYLSISVKVIFFYCKCSLCFSIRLQFKFLAPNIEKHLWVSELHSLYTSYNRFIDGLNFVLNYYGCFCLSCPPTVYDSLVHRDHFLSIHLFCKCIWRLAAHRCLWFEIIRLNETKLFIHVIGKVEAYRKCTLNIDFTEIFQSFQRWIELPNEQTMKRRKEIESIFVIEEKLYIFIEHVFVRIPLDSCALHSNFFLEYSHLFIELLKCRFI